MKGINIPLAGVIGHPIAHSKSPKLHGHWLRSYGINGHYLPLLVQPENLRKVLRSMPDMGFVGANITIPHKEAVLQIADDITPTALRIGAANTLSFGPDGKITADNTDAYGFIENLRQTAPDWQANGGAAMVLGAGGAARAVLVALLDAGAPEILLANRTQQRADDLARAFGGKIKTIAWDRVESSLGAVHTIVNTTSLGMVGQDAFPFKLDNLNPAALATDIVYTPLQTPFLVTAAARGCQTVDGLGMLLHQAAPGFASWFGVTPVVDAALRSAVLA